MIDLLLQASLQLAIAFVFVALLCLLVPRLSASVRCWLWRLVLLKGLLSLVWIAGVPLLDAPALPTLVDGPLMMEPIPAQASTGAYATSAAPAAPGVDSISIVATLWIAGLVLAVARLIVLAGQSRKLRRLASPIRSTPIHAVADWLRRRIGLKVSPDLAAGELVASPLVTGIVSPVVILPPRLLDCDEALKPALAHEMAHVKRLDLLWDLVAALANCAFWFHPLAWISAGRARTEAEIACDAIAIHATDQSPRAYGGLLLGLSQRHCGLSLPFDSPNTLKRRLKAMSNHVLDRRSLRLLFCACVIPAVFAFVPWKVVEAQPSGTGQVKPVMSGDGFARYRSSGVFLSGDPVVRNDLGVSGEQVEALKKTDELFGKEIRALGDKLAEFNRNRVSNKKRWEYDRVERPAVYERFTKRTLEILTPAQQQRLGEMALQFHGPSMARHQAIAKELGLAEATRSKIGSLYDAYAADRLRGNREANSKYFELHRIRVREHTPAEKRLLEKLRKEYYTAEGDKRDEVWKRINIIEQRAVRPRVITQEEMIQGGALDRKVMYENLQSEEAQRRAKLDAAVLRLLKPDQRAKWEQMKGPKIVFTPFEEAQKFVWDGTKYVKGK